MASKSSSNEWIERMALAAKVRRKALGLTQRDVAELAGCHFVFVNELEKGKATLRLDKVLSVLIVLGLTPEIP